MGSVEVRPGENVEQRADRNFSELLQELRVAQTGVQILLAFLLTIPFAAGFARLDVPQRHLYAATVATTTAAMAFLIGPVACHRLSFRQRRKEVVLRVSHVLTLIGLALMALAVLTGVYLATWSALSAAWAVAVTAIGTVCIALCWVVIPVLVRSHSEAI